MNGQLVPMSSLPSKGRTYPADLEIYVKPISVKDQMDLDRYNQSISEYYRILLKGVECQTPMVEFNKESLLLGDVQYLDLIRRLFSKDPEEEIEISDVCPNYLTGDCNNKTVTFDFYTKEVSFLPFIDEVLEKHEDEETDNFYYGKSYTFSDGLELVIAPITVGNFIKLFTEQIANEENKNRIDISLIYLAHFAYSTTKVMDRTFKDESSMRNFVLDYISNLYKKTDKDLLEKIEDEFTTLVRPFTFKCPDCGKEWEVSLQPTTSFR